jgi:putative transposase
MSVDRAWWLGEGAEETHGADAPRPPAPLAVRQVSTGDFVFDAGTNGQPIKCRTVIDEFTRECLAVEGLGRSVQGG